MSRVYYKKLPGKEYNLIHIYEHLIVSGFEDYLHSMGLSPALAGEYGGVTYNEITFFGSYLGYTDDYTDKYLSQKHSFTKQQIKIGLSSIGAEHNAIYSTIDLEKLSNMIAEIDNIPFCNLESSKIAHRHIPMIEFNNKPPKNSLVQIQNGKDEHLLVSINFRLNKPNITETATLSNMDSALKSMVSLIMGHKYGAYRSDDVIEDVDLDGSLLTSVDFYIRKTECDDELIRQDMVKMLESIDFNNYHDQINNFFENPYTPSGTFYDYNSIGLFISKQQLGKYLTTNNVNKLWRKLKVDQINTFPDERDCTDVYLRKDRWIR